MAAKKTSSTTSRPATTPAVSSPAPAAPVSSTPVRNSPIPRPQAQAPTSGFQKKQPSHEQIARRAYEIWQSGKGGSQFDNWVRAERELRSA